MSENYTDQQKRDLLISQIKAIPPDEPIYIMRASCLFDAFDVSKESKAENEDWHRYWKEAHAWAEANPDMTEDGKRKAAKQ